MKTFKDLEFKTHISRPMFNSQAEIYFDNGYGCSVITGDNAYTRPGEDYELAVLRGTIEDSMIDYDTPLTDDVLGYLTPEDVTNAMLEIQKLPSTSV